MCPPSRPKINKINADPGAPPPTPIAAELAPPKLTVKKPASASKNRGAKSLRIDRSVSVGGGASGIQIPT